MRLPYYDISLIKKYYLCCNLWRITSYRQGGHIYGKRFLALSFIQKFAKIFISGVMQSVKRLCLSYIHFPTRGGFDISILAWEWTVYC